MIVSKVGLEAEFLLTNEKGKVIIPPRNFDRDGFPLLGEIRGEEGENPPETLTNFISRKLHIIDKLLKGHEIITVDCMTIPLATYKAVNKEINYDEKDNGMKSIKNIHGINIEDFSDQIIGKNGKIQGIKVSCGLHVHFSCEEYVERVVEKEKFSPVNIPVTLNTDKKDSEVAKEFIKPVLYLFKKEDYTFEETISARASRLCKPAVHFIVSEMDKMFFDRFAPKEVERTKYRQPGFYELKSYGFEYRSLPFNEKVEAALPEITTTAFKLLEEINK